VQPNQLALEDAKRAFQLFERFGVPTAGVVQNMVGDVFGEVLEDVFGLPVLANLPLDRDIARLGSAGQLDKLEDNPFDPISESVFERSVNVDWARIRPVLYEGDDFEEALEKFPIEGGAYGGLRTRKMSFVGLKSWDGVREELQDVNWEMGQQDEFLNLNTADVIRRMLDHLDVHNEGLFMITRRPHVGVDLFPGEIGTAHLQVLENKSSYYGVPRLGYPTDQAEITVFPHEVRPYTHDELMQSLESKELVLLTSSATQRYIPALWVMEQIEHAYGRLCFLQEDWREKYEALGVAA